MIAKAIVKLLGAQAVLVGATVVSAKGMPAGATGFSPTISGAAASHQADAATADAPPTLQSAQAGTRTASDRDADAGPTPLRPPSPHLPPGCTFFLVRHGQSKPNLAGKIVSGMEGGVDPANGLTEEGMEQARRVGKEIKEVMFQAGCSPANTMVLTSPFSRARETAEAIRDCLDCELREERDLRERWFGDLDGEDDAPSYQKVWALDAMSARHGELGVEPANDVAARAAAVVHRVRKEVSIRQRYHTGEGQPFPPGPSAVVLVSHGDALQLLQCLLAGRPLEEHRSLPHLENCGVRVLRPPPDEAGREEGDEGGDSGGGVGVVEGGSGAAFRMTGARVLRPRGEDQGQGAEGLQNALRTELLSGRDDL